jgi:hypothetical protein
MTRQQIEDLKVGDKIQRRYPTLHGQPLPQSRWGEPEVVTRIFARGVSVRGKAYVCFDTRWSPNSEMSARVSEGEGHVRLAG